MCNKNYYTVYKGEDVIAFGTVKECCTKLNIKPKTLLFYGTPTYNKRTKVTKARRLVKEGDIS